MIVSREREKLINAILYFVRETRHCHTLKLFKLLNFLDFEHFRQTGRTVTGLDYKAWDKGPVPSALFGEIAHAQKADLRSAVFVAENKDHITDKVLRRDIKPKRPADLRVFTKREIAIMGRLAEFFREIKGDDMSEFSHMRKLPWRRVYGGGEGKGKSIPPELALESDPLVVEVPTIDQDELEYRKELRRGLA